MVEIFASDDKSLVNVCQTEVVIYENHLYAENQICDLIVVVEYALPMVQNVTIHLQHDHIHMEHGGHVLDLVVMAMEHRLVLSYVTLILVSIKRQRKEHVQQVSALKHLVLFQNVLISEMI